MKPTGAAGWFAEGKEGGRVRAEWRFAPGFQGRSGKD